MDSPFRGNDGVEFRDIVERRQSEPDANSLLPLIFTAILINIKVASDEIA